MRLRSAIARVRRRIELARSATAPATSADAPAYLDEIWIATRDGQIRLRVSAIEWIEAAKDHFLLHTATRSYLHRAQMNALEAWLDPEQLMRVHRSSFVRLSLVETIERPGNGSFNLNFARWRGDPDRTKSCQTDPRAAGSWLNPDIEVRP